SRNGRCTSVGDAGTDPVVPLELSTQELIFPPAQLGSSTQSSFEIFNPNSVEAEVVISELLSPSFMTPWRGTLGIAAGQRMLVTLTFTPLGLGPFTGRLQLDLCGGSCPVEVNLRGEGVD
ncbi:unnamed protein product, partial [Laminaria digitata]